MAHYITFDYIDYVKSWLHKINLMSSFIKLIFVIVLINNFYITLLLVTIMLNVLFE